MTDQSPEREAFAKVTQSELASMSREDISQFVAASVGRLSNLYPHWLLIHVEKPLGITSSRLIVLWLLSSRDSLTMGEIASAIDLTPRGVTRIVDGLESDGLVRRVTDEFDRRIRSVELTTKGKRFVAQKFPSAMAEFERMFSVLDKGEAVELIRLLEKMTDRMKAEISGD